MRKSRGIQRYPDLCLRPYCIMRINRCVAADNNSLFKYLMTHACTSGTHITQSELVCRWLLRTSNGKSFGVGRKQAKRINSLDGISRWIDQIPVFHIWVKIKQICYLTASIIEWNELITLNSPRAWPKDSLSPRWRIGWENLPWKNYYVWMQEVTQIEGKLHTNSTRSGAHQLFLLRSLNLNCKIAPNPLSRLF